MEPLVKEVKLISRMHFCRRRSNTTSTMFICNTMNIPNRGQTIECVSKSVHYALSIHANEPDSVNIDIFDERLYPLSPQKRNFVLVPCLDEIANFVNFLFYKQALSPQVGIMAVHYVDQLINKTGLLVTPSNWRRVLLCSLLVADKVWEEDVVCNSDYCSDSFPGLTVDDLNQLEREFLSALDFKLVLKPSVYAEYYFALRSIAGSEGFPSRPLDKETAQKLDINQPHQSEPVTLKRRRSRSVGLKQDARKRSLEHLSQRLAPSAGISVQ